MNNKELTVWILNDPLKKQNYLPNGTNVIKDDLYEFYKIIDCDNIDIVYRNIGDKGYNIICDDEGLLQDSYSFTAIGRSGNIALARTIIITGKADEHGELTSIDEADIINIINNTKHGRILRQVNCEQNYGQQSYIELNDL